MFPASTHGNQTYMKKRLQSDKPPTVWPPVYEKGACGTHSGRLKLKKKPHTHTRVLVSTNAEQTKTSIRRNTVKMTTDLKN